MSRSYKRSAIIKQKCNKWRKILNRKFRRNGRKNPDDKTFVKNECYWVSDYKFRYSKEKYTDEEIKKARRK